MADKDKRKFSINDFIVLNKASATCEVLEKKVQPPSAEIFHLQPPRFLNNPPKELVRGGTRYALLGHETIVSRKTGRTIHVNMYTDGGTDKKYYHCVWCGNLAGVKEGSAFAHDEACEQKFRTQVQHVQQVVCV